MSSAAIVAAMPGHLSSANDETVDDMDEERVRAQREIQMLDLGTRRREYVTTNDYKVPPDLCLSKEDLLRKRAVNEEGTDAAKWYQENKTAVNDWNNIGAKIADDHADREKLDNLMDGQSHRARLNKNIKEQGGQKYSESSNIVIDDYPRRRRGGTDIGRGMPGRSGRGAPMHMSAGRGGGNVLVTAKPSIPTGPRANRPLDPAIDPNREYGYKTKRGGKTISTSFTGGPPFRGPPPRGGGSMPKNARATMVGSTVRIGPAAASDRKSEPSKRSGHPGPHHAPQMASGRAALNEGEFLRVMSGMANKPTFNNHIQDKSKPAPGSKAAALIEQPAKATKKSDQGTKTSASVKSRSNETPAEAFQKMRAGAGDELSKAKGSIRLAPTHEFAFPPPVIKSGGKYAQGSNVSVHTDGVETATTFNSADFATQCSEQNQSGVNQNHGLSTVATNSSEGRLITKGEQPGSDGLGIHDVPPDEHKNDLISLDQCNGGPATDEGAAHVKFTAVTDANGRQSPAGPHIMDEELDDEVSQISLTPTLLIAPRTIGYRGIRYIRADQIIGQQMESSMQNAQPAARVLSLESNLRATRPVAQLTLPQFTTSGSVVPTHPSKIGSGAHQEISGDSILGEHNLPGRSQLSNVNLSASSREASEWATGNETSARINVTNGLNIGLQTLRENLNLVPSVLGNHNLPGRSREVTEISSAPSIGAPEYATPNVNRFALVATHRSDFQTSKKEDTEMTNEFTNPRASKKMVNPSGLAASKYAIPEAHAATSASAVPALPQRASNTSSLPASKHSKSDAAETTASVIPSLREKVAHHSGLGQSRWALPEASSTTRSAPAVKPATSPAPPEMSILDQTFEDSYFLDATPQQHQDILTPVSRAASDIVVKNVDPDDLLQIGEVQASKALHEIKDRTASASAPPHKESNLADSMWARPDAEVSTRTLSKQKFGRETSASASEKSKRKENSANKADNAGTRKANPFDMGPRSAKRETSVAKTHRTSAAPLESVQAPLMTERAGNTQAAEHRPMTYDELMVRAMRPGPLAGPDLISSGDSTSAQTAKPVVRGRGGNTNDLGAGTMRSSAGISTSSKTTKRVDRGLGGGAKTVASGGRGAAQRNRKSTASLSASRNAYASANSYRTERRTKGQSDTEESEL